MWRIGCQPCSWRVGRGICVGVCNLSPQDLVSKTFLAFFFFFFFFLTHLPGVAAVHDLRSIFFFPSDFMLSI